MNKSYGINISEELRLIGESKVGVTLREYILKDNIGDEGVASHELYLMATEIIRHATDIVTCDATNYALALRDFKLNYTSIYGHLLMVRTGLIGEVEILVKNISVLIRNKLLALGALTPEFTDVYVSHIAGVVAVVSNHQR